MDILFSLFKAAAHSNKWSKIRSGPRIVRFPSGNRSWAVDVLIVHVWLWYLNRMFADDCVCYREIKDTKDTVTLLEGIGSLVCWTRKWGGGGG